MNFRKRFKQGQAGFNRGLTTGNKKLDRAINGIQKYHSYGIAAAPKVGKTTFADFSFVLAPYLQMEREGRLDDIEWIYFSYEIERISKEFKFAAFFMYYDYGIFNFEFNGKTYPMCQDYLEGKLLYVKGLDAKGEEIHDFVPIQPEHSNMLLQIYLKRIIPLFGEYDEEGKQIKPGKIRFIDNPENPTGMWKYCIEYARQNGTAVMEKFTIKNAQGKDEEKEKIVSYSEKNPKKFTIIVTDHVRKLVKERGFTMKENIDKWLEYSTMMRNKFGFTFVNICHSNRGVSNVVRLQQSGEMIFPTSDDVKDTGNLAEESTVLMTLFNPNDEKYNLERHMGVDLEHHPNYRSLHITESRYTECPAHIQMNMFGNVNYFVSLFPN
jgi:hypothetical protein